MPHWQLGGSMATADRMVSEGPLSRLRLFGGQLRHRSVAGARTGGSVPQ
jgi:hypothetical protein